ncbi:RNA polymerase sigma factor [Carboxylicivirga marina]|uniref:RNA polymerase sigma factor n=1 Tax=Carboxylicivirga marina TaxID=2800988 RepID=A0ABS1HN70_9BACT|nr:sigma-70 family RNA polymerase sigma factor [Carboxylicivirga marina]MBK3518614.1 sigma-70 family RNA polymerase sigma factor [Carboxylicivirga marina]
MESLSDEILVEKSRAGNQQAFAVLLERHTDYCYSIVYRMINVKAEAEDIVQDAFVTVWQKIRSFDSQKAKFTTWLYSIATRMAIDALRKRKNQVDVHSVAIISEDHNGFTQLCNNELEESVRQATSSLTELQKAVFVLREIEEMEVVEVSYITGLSAKQIKDNLYVARKQVRERLKKTLSL